MKILFVYPNRNCQIGFNYGVAFLSAALRKEGHETRLLNLNEKLAPLPTEAQIARDVASWKPDLVGFSVVTTQWSYALSVAKAIKRACDAPIVCGGIHATVAPKEILDSDAFDYCIVGEAEEALSDLVCAIECGADPSDIPNLGFRTGEGVQVNPVRPFVDLAELPEKDYEVFDFQRMIDAKNGWVGIMAGRGCPFRCTYCFNHAIVELYQRDTGRSGAALGYIRRHNAEAVVGEIERLLRRYKRIRMIIFDDDLFTMDRTYLTEFCRFYRERVDVPFTANAHVRHFDDDIAGMLAGAGCRIIKFGLESGGERIRREVMNRSMTNDEIASAFDAAHRAGLHSSAFVMFGLPQEGREEVQATIELLGRIKPTRFRWALFFPFPGTKAHAIAERAGLVDHGRLEGMSNFFEASALDFGKVHNLFLEKLQKSLPWHVNACTGRQESVFYRKLTGLLDLADRATWDRISPRMRALDAKISTHSTQKGWPHYAIRYNDFMAVDSSWSD